ncbi:MAG: acyl-CoA thioesterase [Actinobacteria bacterium]|nr:acyl-CoA thioesterase [Actinomycetota bacterium]
MRLAIDPPLDPAAYSFRHRLRARFAETDAMGVVHHSVYALYCEQARVEWMRHLGHDYQALRDEGVDFAVVELFTQFRGPVRFDDEVVVHVGLGRPSRATFQVGYLLTVDDRTCATAVTVHGCVRSDGRATRMPQWLHEVSSRRPLPLR